MIQINLQRINIIEKNRKQTQLFYFKVILLYWYYLLSMLEPFRYLWKTLTQELNDEITIIR